MDLVIQKRSVEYLYNLIFRQGEITPLVPYEPQKHEMPAFVPDQPLPAAPPESEGISSDYLRGFLDEVTKDPSINLHSLLILRHGRILAEANVFPYRRENWHVSHSLCKGITGLAAGMLYDEGKLHLDDAVYSYFPERPALLTGQKMKNVQIRHLLTMTSGVIFNEIGGATEEDLVRGFLESGLHFAPGSEFQYNSMNSYMLSAIVQRITGGTMLDYLKKKLFGPLGITCVDWEVCPRGITKGGWGMYMRPEDMAKIGQMMLQKGIWNGGRIISEEWLSMMTAPQAPIEPQFGSYGYGFQTWMTKRPGGFMFNGLFSQNIIVYPDLEMVIATTAGSNNVMSNGKLNELLEKYFEGDFRPSKPWTARDAHERLLARIRQLTQAPVSRYPDEVIPVWRSLSGRVYTLEPSGVSLLPLVTQAMHNNFSNGVKKIGFAYTDKGFFLLVQEGGVKRRIPVGMGSVIYKEQDFRGEPYLIGASCVLAKNEDDVPVLKIRLDYPEMSNSRLLKIFLYDGRILTKWEEIPGKEMLLQCLITVLEAGSRSNLVKMLAAYADSELVDFKLTQVIEPVVWGEQTFELGRKKESSDQ